MNLLFFLFFIFVGVSSSTPLAPLLYTESPDAIDGQYIVVLRPELSLEQVQSHISSVQSSILAVAENGTNEFITSFSIGTFNGYSARLSAALLAKIRESSDVDFVEVDQIVTLDACASQQTNEWGLDRISEKSLVLDGRYTYPSSAGANVDAYIVDTGIRTTHREFGGRAIWGANYVGDGSNTDCNGHGTHVAGTVGGSTYGVAKGITLIAVKVLGCAGSGSNSGVISGVQYVANSYNSRKRPSVANLSLGGSRSTALDNAVISAIRAGVIFALAAGNENKDACNVSPAGTGGQRGPAITVAATTVSNQGGGSEDMRSSFSNFGPCVDVFAPGELITSAWSTSDTATRTISGTSMASPHVAGVVGLYLGVSPSSTPASLKSRTSQIGTPNLVNRACRTGTTCSQTPNILLYSPCDI